MEQPLLFSRGKLADFLACQRRFQLRYCHKLPWPAPPPDDRMEKARQRGQRFHQMLHRHFLRLPIPEKASVEPELRAWWDVFEVQGPKIPPGRRFPEISLTVPIEDHWLTGRFDLIVLGERKVHIFDWKTEKQPRSASDLQEDLQTLLYQALAVEGGVALGRPILPEQVSLTYWYVNAPEAPVTIRYDSGRHAGSWAKVHDLILEVARLSASGDPLPLTDDLGQCARCAYPVYCGRQAEILDLSDWEHEEMEIQLEGHAP